MHVHALHITSVNPDVRYKYGGGGGGVSRVRLRALEARGFQMHSYAI